MHSELTSFSICSDRCFEIARYKAKASIICSFSSVGKTADLDKQA